MKNGVLGSKHFKGEEVLPLKASSHPCSWQLQSPTNPLIHEVEETVKSASAFIAGPPTPLARHSAGTLHRLVF